MKDEAISALLLRAAEIVRDLKLPEHLQPEALRQAVTLMTLSAAPAELRSQEGRLGPDAVVSTANSGTTTANLDAISNKLAVEATLIRNVFALEGGLVQVIVPPSRLSSTRRAAMRELILLYVAARQLGGWDSSSTLLTLVRSACESYGPKYFDPNNFMNAVSDLADALRKIGDGKDVKVILTPTGVDDSKQLVQKMGTRTSNPV